MVQFNFEAIGTHWQIDIYQDISSFKEEEILVSVKNRIEIFDKTYSRFRTDSLVTEMSKKVGIYILPDDAKEMLAVYRDLYIRTNGHVTPLIGNIISDAGYDAEYSLKQKKDLFEAPKWENVIEYVYPALTVKQPVLLDFGACGKGYLVDIVGGVIEACGIFQYCIDAGGDILHKGPNSIRVGLENPENNTQALGIYTLQNGSICGSALNRRKWENFTHVINPKTLTSPKEILAVWVATQTALVADALATGLFFESAKAFRDRYDFEYLIVRSDFSIEKSPNFSNELFMLG
ncbi:MAG: FAD:protein FMN transferase [Candidatus Pacebacteria bacterium]|nr:FAD:protein FMN transferase [Candidatus Paceibacterota bacterium]